MSAKRSSVETGAPGTRCTSNDFLLIGCRESIKPASSPIATPLPRFDRSSDRGLLGFVHIGYNETSHEIHYIVVSPALLLS
jgi:hypothetical protein